MEKFGTPSRKSLGIVHKVGVPLLGKAQAMGAFLGIFLNGEFFPRRISGLEKRLWGCASLRPRLCEAV